MSNTFTKLTQDTRGVYKHHETGFTVCEVSSVKHVIECNGALACDIENGEWTWVAGEDLYVEVYRRNGNSLRGLAQGLLSRTFGAFHGRLGLGFWLSNVGSSNVGSILLPGLNRTSRSYGSDIRLFGIMTNAQAGRGCSVGMIDDLVPNSPGGLAAGCTIRSKIPGHIGSDPAAVSSSIPGMGGSPIDYGKSATVVGRVVIAIPLRSWDAFLQKWRDNVPNIDKSEVAEKADAAALKFRDAFMDNLYSVPSVRVPMILMSDGSAYLDGNPTRSHCAAGGAGFGIGQYWNVLHSPTLPDNDGWWVTNPLCPAVGVSHRQLGESYSGLNGSFFNTAGVESNKVALSRVISLSKINAVDGVPLFKVLGGLYPRTDEVIASQTTQSLITKCFSGNHSDQNPPTQGGTETIGDYETRLQALSTGDYNGLTANFGHWNLAGQVAVLASTLLDAAMLNKSVYGYDALTLTSGCLCSSLRVGGGTTVTAWKSADLIAQPEVYLRHQYS